MMRLSTILTSLACCLLSVSAQPLLPPKADAFMPAMLRNNVLKLSDLETEFKAGGRWGQMKKSDRPWVVYSDRDRNVAYMEPTVGSAISPKRLSFGEQVVVAKIENNMALVYTDPKLDKFPDIPSNAKSIGWVPMEHLLLWSICPSDDQGVLKKAFVGHILNKKDSRKGFSGNYYKHPTKNTNPECSIHGVWASYIMKETPDGTRALLSLQSRLTGNNLYGWVNRDDYVAWNQRLCIEPNWNPDFVDNHINERAYFYNSDSFSEDEIITYWQYGQQNHIDNNRSTMYRMEPSLLRYPVLEEPDKKKNAIRCLAFVDNTRIDNTINKELIKRILGERGYDSWKQVRAENLIDSYVKLKDSDGNDYWHYIIYLSPGELEDLIAKLKTISEAAKMKSQDRTHFINAIRALLKMQLGDDDEKRINNMSSSELETAIYGLNIPTESMRFTKYSLKDMANSSVVKNPEYFEILDNFSKKYEELRRLQYSGYKYRLEVNHVFYYWIPIEMLP